MKKRIILISLLGLLILVGLVFFLKRKHFFSAKAIPIQDKIERRPSEPVLDNWHPDGNAKKKERVHYAVILNGANDLSLPPEQIAQVPTDQPLLLTIEMWGSRYYNQMNYLSLQQISQGKHDEKIKLFCQDVLEKHPRAYLRWNPEMELPGHHVPWLNDPAAYIAAFRHFATLVRTYVPQVQIVWGPAGYPGALEFWPGEEYVDWISISLNGQNELQAGSYPRADSIPVLLRRKLHRLRFVDKPVLILGSEEVSQRNYRTAWLKDHVQLVAEETAIYGRHLQADGDPTGKQGEKTPLQLGVYDPHLLLAQEEAIDVEHLFVDFENLANGRFQTAFEGVISRGHDAIVTVEPMERQEDLVDRNVLAHILAGQYDSVFQEIYGLIGNAGQRVYLRFAHEMEIPITRYPWQSQDPVLYIKAFRHFMQLQDDSITNILRVWGPAGDRGSLEWWPGEDVVDLISIAIYGLPDKNITDPNQQESFARIFERKYRRMRFVNKPIFITEFGVKGPEAYQSDWLADAAQVIKANPQIVSINYFNMVDSPEVWGDIDAPDWSINRRSFSRFVALLSSRRTQQGMVR
jgi:beta-mannanase